LKFTLVSSILTREPGEIIDKITRKEENKFGAKEAVNGFEMV